MGTVLILILLCPPIWGMWTWNRLVALRAAMRAAWASTDALLKRRADLIPNLVAVVKGGMSYEAGTLERVVEARNATTRTGGLAARAGAEEELTGSVHQLFAVSSAIPI